MTPFDTAQDEISDKELAETLARYEAGRRGRLPDGESALPNNQLYGSSCLAGSQTEQDYATSPDRLFNDKSPNLAVLHEKPEHRVALFLKAQGLSNREIAQRTGWTDAWVSQLTRQPWFRARLVAELSAAGRDSVSEVIKASALDSVWRLIDERDNTKAKPSERIAAANSLLDRFLGKPTQRVETVADVTTHNATTLDEIEKRLDELKLEEKRLGALG